jgi:hypothetical protein
VEYSDTDYSKPAQVPILLDLDCQIQALEEQAASNVPVTSPALTIRQGDIGILE